jgi:DNA-binding NarL/FixJ family response regulator
VLVLDRSIDRVAVVDDDPQARRAYGLTVVDADFTLVEEIGPLNSVSAGVASLRTRAEAVLCDQNLRKRSYATFNGAEFVAACNVSGLPAILCTQYRRPDVAHIRRYRRHVPVLVQSEDLEPDSLLAALRTCVQEIKYGPSEHRRLWRAQVRVTDIGDPDQAVFYVHVPAWGIDERVGVLRSDVPSRISALLSDGQRFHVEVNLGAESADELYFGAWETR